VRERRPTIFAAFSYRNFSVPLELCDLGTDVEIRVACPLCGKKCRLNPERHSAVVDHAQRKVLSITPVVSCPGCSWRVVVSGGTAFDVASPATVSAIESTSHPERDRLCACGRRFRSKTYDECEICRDENEVRARRRAGREQAEKPK
jgi:hypothetical protein